MAGIGKVMDEVKNAVVGKDAVLLRAVLAILAGGHILLEDVPSPTTSMLLLEQLRTIDRKRLCGDIERISKGKMLKVDAVLVISINLKPQA